jgi:hypothetical protein
VLPWMLLVLGGAAGLAAKSPSPNHRRMASAGR